MKKILGLDLGTNSIGWALIETSLEATSKKTIYDTGKILGLGSRIIPMQQNEIDDFGKGVTKSATADRTDKRGTRRLYQRDNLRRERLHRILNILNFLPEHYKKSIDFEKRKGQFFHNTEIKLPYKPIPKENDKQKYEFIFKDVFEEMLSDFKKHQPELFYKKKNKEETKIPYDWTIYYLRKKALEKQITDEQLAWLILHFNTKRGYYQQRDDEEFEQKDKKTRKEYITAIFEKIEDTGEKDQYDNLKLKTKIVCDLGTFYPRMSKKTLPEWTGQEKDLVLSITLDKNKKDKINDDGKIDCRVTVPKKDDYHLLKAKAERAIDNSNETVGSYIYDTLLKKPNQKVRGLLVRTIERKYYKEELEKILKKQMELNPKFKNLDLYQQCIKELYPLNNARRDVLNSVKDENKFKFLFVNDIIFYHRPLKTKKSLIADCKFETRVSLIPKANFKDIYNKADLDSKEKIEEFISDIQFVVNVKRKNKKGKLITIKENITGEFIDFKESEKFKNHIFKYSNEYDKATSIINKDGVYFTKFKKTPIKAIAKSNPYYQEFRIWQFIDNLKIKEKEKEIDGKLKSDVDVTCEFIKTEEDKERLFDEFNKKEKITQSQFLAIFKDSKGKKLSEKTHKWNYVEKNEYPLNETKHILTVKFKNNKDYLNFYKKNEYRLWHLFYSISSKDKLKKALKKLYKKNKDDYNLPEDFVDKALKIKSFKKDYATLSEKALKKILPLLRIGKYANENEVLETAKLNIDNIYKRLESNNLFKAGLTKEDKINKISELANDEITKGMLNSFVGISQKRYTDLQMYQASYAVYGKHSEAKDTEKWNTPKDIEKYLTHEFKQHSLRNPIVEKVVTETLRVVKDIWEQFGNSEEDYFSEIHVELGRDLKNTKSEKERLTDIVTDNKKTNQRIITLLRELKKENIKNVRPESTHQRDKLKIFEHDILSPYSEKELKKQVVKGHGTVDIYKIANSNEPSSIEIEKYRLWLEQKYCSPFTGKIIPLSDLFTPKYEVEHVLPQARYLDNSYSNKVICETAVNKAKGKLTGYEFVIKSKGEKFVELKNGEKRKIVSQTVYEKFVSDNFTKGTKKHKILLSEDIPTEFTDQQKSNMRYISREMGKLLSRIVRVQGENEVFSKNLLPVSGKATNMLKHDWGLNQIWYELIMPRFERLNKLTGTKDFTYYSEKLQKELPSVPPVLKQSFDAKRIDHRHHALDALIVACTTRSHTNYINNQHAKSENKRFDLKKKLADKQYDTKNSSDYKWVFKNPWDNFVIDTKNSLKTIIVSFKQNMRILVKATNKYISYKDEDGNIRFDNNGKPKKGYTKQIKWDMRTIRQPLHEETVQGKSNIRFEKKVKFSVAIEGLVSNFYVFKDKKLGKHLKKQIRNGKLKNEIIADFKKKKYEFNGKDISDVIVYYFSNANNIPETEHKVAVRKDLSPALFSFTDKKKSYEKIKETISNTGIQNILLKHLKKYNTVKISILDILDKPEVLKDENLKTNIITLNNKNINLIEYFQKEKTNKQNEVEIFISKTEMEFLKEDTIENPDLAFSPEGVEEMNKNIIELNNGKKHKPIYKVRIYTKLGNKFNIGEKRNKDKKYVVTGLNPYFAVYSRTDENQKEIRKYQTISLTTTINRLKDKLSPVPEKYLDENEEYDISFYLQPNDLVYVPENEETKIDFDNLTESQHKRIYKFTDGSGTTANFVPHYAATTIFNMNADKQKKANISLTFKNEKGLLKSFQNEFGVGSQQSKSQNTLDGTQQIKKECIKLKVDRLGNLSKA